MVLGSGVGYRVVASSAVGDGSIARSRRRAAVGTTRRRPRRIVGMSPRRAASYALPRQIPRMVAARSTVTVGSVLGSGSCVVFMPPRYAYEHDPCHPIRYCRGIAVWIRGQAMPDNG